MSWALRKSSKLCSAVATARRWRVGRPLGVLSCPFLRSVLVIVAPVRCVPVPVVDVVDMIPVRYGGVPASLPVLVRMPLGRDSVPLAQERARGGAVSRIAGDRPPEPLSSPGQHPEGVRRDEAGQRD